MQKTAEGCFLHREVGMIPVMTKVAALLFFLAPLCALGYASVVVKPADATVVLPIRDAAVPQEFFGVLRDHPHTFQFAVDDAVPFTASVFVLDDPAQMHNASIILVKEEQRGVQEIGRTKGIKEPWELVADVMLAESFRKGGTLAATLEPGMYRLEVSSPNNDARYRLVLGHEPVTRSYFENLAVLFEVRALFGASQWGSILSPLVYVPLLMLSIVLSLWGAYRYRKRMHARNI